MDQAKKWVSKNAVIVFLFAIIIVFGATNETFLTPNNIINITSQMSINALLATGITFVIITGGIDISIGSVAAFAGIFAAFIGLKFPNMSTISGALIQIGSAVLIGGICGLFNGLMITKFKVVPMIATLSMMTIARGLAYVVTGGQPVYGLSKNFSWMGAGRMLRTGTMSQGVIPIITLFTIIVVVIMHLLLTKTVFGRHVYAVGSNESVAHLSGISVDQTKISVYVICSIMAALGGVCVASKLNNGQPASCEGYEMYAIASTVLGGTSFAGGIGSVARAMIGVAIIAIINNGMNLMQVSSYWQKVITGLIILVAVIVDMAQKKQSR
ncbi:ABC transporter permease [Oscillospiraceae bacterium PP1C4]